MKEDEFKSLLSFDQYLIVCGIIVACILYLHEENVITTRDVLIGFFAIAFSILVRIFKIIFGRRMMRKLLYKRKHSSAHRPANEENGEF